MPSCSSIASLTARYWDQYEEVITLLGKADPRATAVAQAFKAADKMVGRWNALIGDSALKIGPRKLELGKPVTGTVTGPTQRMWITSRPTARAATVRIKKLDGKMKTRVTICAHDKGGGHRMIRSFQTDRSDKDGSTWSAKVPENCLVSVLITGRVGLNKFKYSLEIGQAKAARKPALAKHG